MNPSPKYWLPAAWLLVFALRMAGARDPITLWALRLLTAALLVAVCFAAVEFINKRIQAKKTGQRVLTESTLRGVMLAGLLLGFVLRIVGWDNGDEGLIAWIGGVMVLASLAGLLLLSFLKERANAAIPSFFFNPNWKYGLVLVCIATITIQSLLGPEGTASSLNVWLFTIAAITLIVQTVGRLIVRWRGRSTLLQGPPGG